MEERYWVTPDGAEVVYSQEKPVHENADVDFIPVEKDDPRVQAMIQRIQQ